MARPAELTHLARRFVGSLRPGGPPPADEAWVADCLSASELALWERMSGADRRHAVGVAREVCARGFDDAPAVAAALLHDVGKVEAGVGTWARAAITAVALVVGRERLVNARREGRVQRYLRHDAVGAALLEAAGADPLVVRWAREHHLDPGSWTVPPEVGAALKAADDD